MQQNRLDRPAPVRLRIFLFEPGGRTREIGLRMALGATPVDVLSLFIRSGLGLCLAGTAVGLAVSFAATRLLRSQLYRISPLDPPTRAAASILLIAIGVAANSLPARRAVRTDPVEALRQEWCVDANGRIVGSHSDSTRNVLGNGQRLDSGA